MTKLEDDENTPNPAIVEPSGQSVLPAAVFPADEQNGADEQGKSGQNSAGTNLERFGALSISEFCERMGLGRTTVQALIKRGELPVKRVGRRTLIPLEAAAAWLNG